MFYHNVYTNFCSMFLRSIYERVVKRGTTDRTSCESVPPQKCCCADVLWNRTAGEAEDVDRLQAHGRIESSRDRFINETKIGFRDPEHREELYWGSAVVLNKKKEGDDVSGPSGTRQGIRRSACRSDANRPRALQCTAFLGKPPPGLAPFFKCTKNTLYYLNALIRSPLTMCYIRPIVTWTPCGLWFEVLW